MNDIRHYEEWAMNAWPCLQTRAEDGWLLRWAQGYTKRSNSVQPLYPAYRPLEDKIRDAELFYGRQGLPVVFKMTEASEPAGLDAELEQRGYALVEPVSIRTLRFAEGLLPQPAYPEAELSPVLTEAWLSAFLAFNPAHEAYRETILRLFSEHPAQCCFAVLKADGETVACGLSVLHGGESGLFDIVTGPAFRRQGYGESLILHLLHWSREQGSEGAFLQVLADNEPAVRLYDKLGFTERFRQWYRVKKQGVEGRA
ncbi:MULTISPECIES: GNAT family N-acetyltransferase [Paenibacillus]|uniref:GNAT family N-acetyltransferase n=1 Tax=Paenibacillus TaxID=44249 RepID=UPI0022B89366|nr:GNAT family N-acetyltransferase [Paenibacillus caseinilyticus]MCZ8522264.1 GNAT family N-acetyltransferase [Paenibacillus caseinilyticus]